MRSRDVVIPLVAVILPGNVVLAQVVTNALDRRRWDGENGVSRVGVNEGVIAIAEKARIVIVEQVVVTLFAARIDWRGGSAGGSGRASRSSGLPLGSLSSAPAERDPPPKREAPKEPPP